MPVSIFRLLAALVCASVIGVSSPAVADAQTDALATRWSAALEKLRGGECDGKTWLAVSEDTSFPKLSSEQRAITYINMGACIGGSRRHEWRVLASKEPDAPPMVWGLLFLEAVDRHDTPDALKNLEADLAAARRTGQAFDVVNDDGVYFLNGRLRTDPAAKMRLLSVLDAAEWKPSDPSQDLSPIWLELSLMLLEQGKTGEAARVAKKVTAAESLLGMRLDNRFASLLKDDPQAFDVEYAAFADLRRLERVHETAENNDNSAYLIIDALRVLGRLDEALEFADRVLKKEKILDENGRDYRNWIEDRRAYVLLQLGRFDEAVTTEQTAATRPERGGANVSQVINLAEMLIDQGRFQQALAVLAKRDKDAGTSAVGKAYIEQDRVCIFNGLGDAAQQDKALAYTAAHVGDNRTARLHALLCANDSAAASRLMVDWLEDPLARERALIQLCTAPSRPLGSYQAVLSQRFDQVRKDPAVVAAVAKVGRTEALKAIGAVWPDFP